jgi:hypothetical protein
MVYAGDFQDEFFGSEAQITVSRRACDLWALCDDDPRFSYNGRMVVINGEIGPETVGVMAAVARLQGAVTNHFFPEDQASKTSAAIEALGLSCNRWEFYYGQKTAYEAAKDILAKYQLPDDLTVERLCPDTPAAQVADLAGMAADCEVLVMSGRVMRGLDIEGVTLGAFDQSGVAVSSAWGYKCYHPESGLSENAFWGGLTCREDRRGQKVALILGAMSIVTLWEDHGVRGFCTGITAGNMPSVAVCEKLRVLPSDWVGLGVTDPKMFDGGRLTK